MPPPFSPAKGPGTAVMIGPISRRAKPENRDKFQSRRGAENHRAGFSWSSRGQVLEEGLVEAHAGGDLLFLLHGAGE